MKIIHALMLGGALVALASPAFGQTTEERAGDTEIGAQEIVVTGAYTLDHSIDTATGLGLTLRETPQSVSVMTAQRILDQNLDSIAEVLTNAIGVSVDEIDDVRNEFKARGFEIKNYQIDGVPLAWTLAGGAGETIADVSLYERIEIVRGATGLLTGVGDPSASVNMVRKHADRTDVTGYVNASIGSWNTRQLSADVGGAVTEDSRLRFRAIAKYEDGESFIDLYENRKLVLYGVIDADVTNDTLLRVGFSHQQGKPNAPAWGALPSFYDDGSFITWPRSKTASADWTYWDTTNQNFFVTLSHKLGENWKATFNYNRLRNAQTTEILYLSGLVDRASGAIQFSYPYSDDGESILNSYDFQLKGSFGLFGREHEVVLGASRSIMSRDNTTYAALAFPPVDDFVNWDGAAYPYPGFLDLGTLAVKEKTRQTGFFGALRLNVSDSLKLIGGGRLATWKLDGFNFGPQRSYGDDNVFIPYAGILYDLTPSHRVYASYTEIFEPQNARDRFGDYLDPIVGKSYEIGLKSGFFNERLQTSIAIFRIEQDNLAQPDTGYFVPGVTPPAEASFAAEGATSEGFEIEVTGQPVEGWNLSMGYSQFKAEDAAGAPVNTDHPRKLLKLFTTYRLPGALSALTIGGGVNYRSKNYSEGLNPVTGNGFRFQQDGYTLVSLMARYELTEQLQLQANVENLFDKSYYSQIGFYSQYRYGKPRNFAISAMYRF